MKAGGISVYRAAGPVLGMGLLVEPPPLRDAGVDPARHEQGGGPRLQRHQGPPGAVLRPVRPPLGPGAATSASTTSTTSWSARRAGARGGGAGAGRRVLGLRLLDLRRGPEDLGPARAPLRPARRVGRRRPHLRPGERLAPHGGDALRLPAVRSPARAGDRPRPGRRDRAAVLLPARGEALGHDGLRRAAGLHRLARGPRLRRGQAPRPAPPQAGLPHGRPRHDAARRALLLRRGAAGGALRHRHRDRDRDRVLGGPGDLRGPREQRAPPPGPRRLGPEPDLRRRRALPDPARWRRDVIPSRGRTTSRARERPRSRHAHVADPDRALRADLHRGPVQHEDEGARLAGVEPAVGLRG